jgi:hypothetical protein
VKEMGVTHSVYDYCCLDGRYRAATLLLRVPAGGSTPRTAAADRKKEERRGVKMVPNNGGYETTPEEEWNFVVNPNLAKTYPGGRRGTKLDVYNLAHGAQKQMRGTERTIQAAGTSVGNTTNRFVDHTKAGELRRAIDQHRQDQAHYNDALQRLNDIENRLRIETPKVQKMKEPRSDRGVWQEEEVIAELEKQRRQLKSELSLLQALVEEGHIKVTGLTVIVGEERARGVAVHTFNRNSHRSDVDPGARRSTSPDGARTSTSPDRVRTTSHRDISPDPGGKGRRRSASPKTNPRRGSGSPAAMRLQHDTQNSDGKIPR